MALRKGWVTMGTQVCDECGLAVQGNWRSRHSRAGCDARVGLGKNNQFNDARFILGDYIKATGSHSRIELEEYLLANFPCGVSWKANAEIAAGVVEGFMKFHHIGD